MASTTRRDRQTSMHVVSMSLDCEGTGLEAAAEGVVVVG